MWWYFKLRLLNKKNVLKLNSFDKKKTLFAYASVCDKLTMLVVFFFTLTPLIREFKSIHYNYISLSRVYIYMHATLLDDIAYLVYRWPVLVILMWISTLQHMIYLLVLWLKYCSITWPANAIYDIIKLWRFIVPILSHWFTYTCILLPLIYLSMPISTLSISTHLCFRLYHLDWNVFPRSTMLAELGYRQKFHSNVPYDKRFIKMNKKWIK